MTREEAEALFASLNRGDVVELTSRITVDMPGLESERAYVISVIEELPCKCEDGKDYCDGHTDAIAAVEAIDTSKEVML